MLWKSLLHTAPSIGTFPPCNQSAIWNRSIVACDSVNIWSPSGKLLKKPTIHSLTVLPIPVTASISYFHLPVLLTICSSGTEDTLILCLLVIPNFIKTPSLIDACLNISTDSYFFLFLFLFTLAYYVCMYCVYHHFFPVFFSSYYDCVCQSLIKGIWFWLIWFGVKLVIFDQYD